jgi:hypothetical protein
METGQVVAAAISGCVLLGTQIATLAQVQRHKNRSEKFERTQSELNNEFVAEQNRIAQDSATKLAELENKLKRGFDLQTRWDPVRFEIYAEVFARAVKLWELARKLVSIQYRRSKLIEDKKNNIGVSHYENGIRTLSEEQDPLEECWKTENDALESALSRADMIATPPVRNATNELAFLIQEWSKSTASVGADADFQKRFYEAKCKFRDAVRVELGSDHYADEDIRSVMTD